MITNAMFRRSMLLVVVLVVALGSLTGCASLRKKFTRVKKDKTQKEEFIPVLEPVEYKKVELTTAQAYGDHFAMLKVYLRDLGDVLSRHDGSDKREKYVFTQLLVHLDAITALLPEDKKAVATGLRARIDKVLLEYDKPSAMRRYDLVISNMRQVEREILKELKPAVVSKMLTP